MGIKKLTRAVRDEIAVQAVKDLYISGLREAWETVKQRMPLLCESEIYKDFDWAHVEAYREYINWHQSIRFSNLPYTWGSVWSDNFHGIFGLEKLSDVAVGVEIPSSSGYTPTVPDKYKKQVEDILRPYMIKYFQAKKAFAAIQEVLSGLATSRQVEEFVPELAKYLPVSSNGQANALVPIEQINEVRGLFPRAEGAA